MVERFRLDKLIFADLYKNILDNYDILSETKITVHNLFLVFHILVKYNDS